LLALAALLSFRGAAYGQLVGTKHNLSVSSPGLIKAFGEEEVCVFCHTPHWGLPKSPLWNTKEPKLTYTPYSSSTLTSKPGQPTGSSKLCLSCHDGTIALGKLISKRRRPIKLPQRITGRASLDTDLSDDHPISFVYDSALLAGNPELVDPSLLEDGPVKLDETSQMQCISCHDSHSSDYPKFLVVNSAYSGLCVACHEKRGWAGSEHDVSPATWSGIGDNPWPNTEWTTVAENGCQSCHAPHSAGRPERLLLFAAEEDNCLSCHDGSVAATDIAAELDKASTHPVSSFLGEHDPGEDFRSMPRHVECQDCHNPHAVVTAPATAPFASGALAFVPGVSAQGTQTEIARFEYEVCLRCHLDESSPVVIRQIYEPNMRLKFDVANPSHHAVMGPGRNLAVPSLIPPWTVTSYVYCTDCHSNDRGPEAAGGGPRGPHGSNWPFLLERPYTTVDGAAEDPNRYGLCYKCHSRSSLLNDDSFPTHRKHIVDARTSCATCHDPHGISGGQGDSTRNSHLINFSTDEVVPNSLGDLFFEDRGSLAGSCSLSCHDFDHIDTSYQR
jgi:predicted CXXCH cytochrome family protein